MPPPPHSGDTLSPVSRVWLALDRWLLSPRRPGSAWSPPPSHSREGGGDGPWYKGMSQRFVSSFYLSIVCSLLLCFDILVVVFIEVSLLWVS